MRNQAGSSASRIDQRCACGRPVRWHLARAGQTQQDGIHEDSRKRKRHRKRGKRIVVLEALPSRLLQTQCQGLTPTRVYLLEYPIVPVMALIAAGATLLAGTAWDAHFPTGARKPR